MLLYCYFTDFQLNFRGLNGIIFESQIKKLVRRVEPTKQYTKSQNKYEPETKQLKIKGVKYPNEQSDYRRGIRNLKNNCDYCIYHYSIA